MRTITTAIIKGGTGKSSTAAALAQAARDPVLLIDLDPQANASLFTGADITQPGAYQLLHGAHAAEVIQRTEQGIDVIAASSDLATETTKAGSARRLREALQPIKDKYKCCLIDTAPAMGELLYNALEAADGLLIPLEADNASVQGFYQIADIAEQMQQSNTRLEVVGVVLTRYDGRPKLNRYLKQAIEETAAEIGAPYLGEIRQGVAIREAQSLQRSLYDYAPRSNPAKDYKALFEKVFQ